VRTRLILAALPLTVAVACSRPAADPAAERAPLSDPNLMIGAGFMDATPIASDVEVNRQPQGAVNPRPAPTPPAQPAAARSARLPAAEVPDEERGGHAEHGVAADPAPELVLAAEAPRAGEGAPEAGGTAAGTVTGGSGKPRPVMDEGPIHDPHPRGGIVIIRGGAGTIDDDCAIHPRNPREPVLVPVIPPIVAAQPPDNGTGVLINDRTPPGGSIAGNRPPPIGPGEHPAGRGIGRAGVIGGGPTRSAPPVRGGRGGLMGRGGIR
jgi:hypothetical protein